MGFGGISWPQLLIILAIIILLFGTTKLRSLGSDLGTAIKGFRKGMKDGEEAPSDPDAPEKTGDDDSTRH